MLNATLLTPTSVSLSWTPPVAPRGIVVSYSIHIVDGNSSHRRTSTGHNRTKLVITGLYPGEDYSVAVAAVNGIGEGLQSSAVNVSTPLPSMYVLYGGRMLQVNLPAQNLYCLFMCHSLLPWYSPSLSLLQCCFPLVHLKCCTSAVLQLAWSGDRPGNSPNSSSSMSCNAPHSPCWFLPMSSHTTRL